MSEKAKKNIKDMTYSELITELYRIIADRKTAEKQTQKEAKNAFILPLLEAAKMNRRFDVNTPFRNGRSLFADAAYHGRMDIMWHLANLKADINRATPLFSENQYGGYTPMEYGGYTPLHYAAMKGRTDAVAFLLERGVKPLETIGHTGIIVEENEGVSPPSPLRLALPYPSTLSVLLVAMGPTYLGEEVCEAVSKGYARSLRVLLKHSTEEDVNVACDDNNSTPLYIAGRVAYHAAKRNDPALREKGEQMFKDLLNAKASISTVVEDEYITPKEKSVMSIERHAIEGHFTPVCLRALIARKEANTHGRRRHLTATRLRRATTTVRPSSSSSKSKSKSTTRRKSRNNE